MEDHADHRGRLTRDDKFKQAEETAAKYEAGECTAEEVLNDIVNYVRWNRIAAALYLARQTDVDIKSRTGGLFTALINIPVGAPFIKTLIEEHGFDPSVDDCYVFGGLCGKGETSLVEDLLKDDRINPAASESSALVYAAVHGHEDIVRLLLDDGRADPTAQRNECLLKAVGGKHIGTIRMLLEDGRIDVTKESRLLLHITIRDSLGEVIGALLEDDRIDLSQVTEERMKQIKEDSNHPIWEYCELHDGTLRRLQVRPTLARSQEGERGKTD